MRISVIAIAAAAIVAPTPAQAITSIEAYKAIMEKMNQHCLLGSLTGATKREVAKILRDAQAWRCKIYVHQFDRLVQRLVQRCVLGKEENSELCASLIQVRRLPPPDPRRRE
jgi:hypothetical protein